MTNTSIRRSGSQLAIALCLSLAMGGAALAETTVETNSVLGTYLAARLAQGLRDTDAANALLKVALERDPGNAALLDQAFISEITAGNWQQAVGYATRAVASDPGNHLAHLVLGVDAFKAGRLGDAEKHFAEPANTPVALMARAWVLNTRKDQKGAGALLGSINDPNWVGFFRKLQAARMTDINGDAVGAGRLYQELFAANPGEYHLALAYARHASHSGDAKLAADVLGKHSAAVQQTHPMIDAAVDALSRGETLPLDVSSAAEGLAGVFYGFSQAVDGQGGVDLATIYTQLSLKLKPDDQLALFSLATIFEQVHKYDSAISTYKRLPADSPLHFDASVREGLNLNALEKTDDAKAALLSLANPAPTPANPPPGQNRAALHTEVEAAAGVSSHEHGVKVAALQKLFARAGLGDGGADGNFGPATLRSLGQLQRDAGLPETGAFDAPTRKALEDRILAAAPQTAKPLSPVRLVDLYTTIGNMLRGRKMFGDAADYYGKAIALIDKPVKPNWDQFYARAVCFERLNKWSQAEPDFLKAMELNPDEPLILNYLGYSWVDRKEHIDKALELIKKAVSLKPDDGYYVDSLGWAYFRMGRYKDAVEQLEHAVELKAEDPVINDHLGDAYWRDGRKLEAQFQWSTSLSSKPEAEDVPRLQDKLKNGLPDDTGAATAAKDAKPGDAAGTDKPKQP